MDESFGNGIINREIWNMNEQQQPFNVKEFENLGSFAARKRYADQTLRKLGAGTARTVYEIDPTKVLKLAKNQKGIAQNEVEIGMGMNDYYAKGVVAEVFEADEENNTWLIAEMGKKITPARFYQLTGVKIKELAQWLDHMYMSNNPSKSGGYTPPDVSPEKNEEFWDNESSSAIMDLMSTYDLPSGDLGRISSYGEVVRNGQPDVVLTDYGLTSSVYSSHYEKPTNRYGYREGVEETDMNVEDKLDNFVVGRDKTDGGYGGFAIMPQTVDEDFIYEAKIESEVGWFDIDERLAPQQNDLFVSHLEVFDKGQGNFKQLLSDIEEFAREHGKHAIVLEPDITQGGEYREFLQDLYTRYGFKPMPEDPSLMSKSLDEGLADELVTTSKMNTPIGKIFSFGSVDEGFEDYTNIAPILLQQAVKYMENIKQGADWGSHISDIYKNYLINVQNYQKGLEMADNDIEYFNNLIAVQDWLKKFGLVKEDLTEDLVYWGADGAGPESDEYKIGAEGISENGSSLFMTQNGSDGELEGDDVSEDETLVKKHELEDVMDTIRGVFAIISPHQIENNKKNNNNSKVLQNFLNKFGFDYNIGIGEWDNDTDTHEQSFIIKKLDKLSNKEFLKIIKSLADKFNQQAFIIGGDEHALLVQKDGTVEEIGSSIEFTDTSYVGFDFLEEGELIGEAGAGISRLMQHMKTNDFAIMSANRNELDSAGNRQENQKLSQELQTKQAGFVNLIGHWDEIRTGDQETIDVKEQSFFIPKPKELDSTEFRNWIINLGKQYNQEAVLIGTPEGGAVLYYMNGSTEPKGKPSLENINKAYSQLRRKPDVAFVFENRIKTWMPKMTTPVIKKSCKLGGKSDGTSDDCSQGDAGAVSYKKIKDGHSHKPNTVNVAEEEKWFDKKINEIIKESIINRKEKDEIFDYGEAKSDAWRKPIQKAQEFYKINFDLENDDSTKEKKTIFVKKNLRKDQPIKYEINAELWEAGGDWEYPVLYFKVELTHDYGLKRDTHNDKKEFPWDVDDVYGKKHVMIPPVEAGNKLMKYRDNAKDKYEWAAWQDEYFKEEGVDEKDCRITDADKKSAWKWLEDTLTKAVDKRHKMLDESVTFKVTSTYIKSMINEANILTLDQLPFADTIEGMGGQIYSVGGAVRDEFLGKESKDLDILITGIPMDRLEQILSRYGKVDAVGKSFGILKFVPKGSKEDIDVAVPRTESATGDGGHKSFDVTTDHTLPIEKDLERRDFTINAIAKDVHGNIIDPFGGQEDLKKKSIRLVNPQAFSDDPLRMLRAVQFATRFGFTIEPNTMAAIKANASRIREISPERILGEFDKIVKKGDALMGADLLRETGLFEQIFGRSIGINRALPWDRIQSMGEFIWTLGVNAVDDVAEFYKRNLKGDIPTYKFIKALDLGLKNGSDDVVKNRGIVSMMNGIAPDSLKSELLPPQLKIAVQELVSGKYPLSLKQLAVNGNDLMQLGLKGQEVGQALKSMLINVYADKVKNDKNSLLNFLNSK